MPNLKLLRGEYGISQQKFADAIGVSQPYINKCENLNIEPEIETLMRMADYFNTSIDYIVGHTHNRRKIEPTQYHHLNPYEAETLKNYRVLSKEQKSCIDLTVKIFLKNKNKSQFRAFGFVK